MKHKTDSGMQYMLRNTFSKFIGFRGPGGEGPNPEATTAHYRSKYIEVYEKDEMCGTHIFRLEVRKVRGVVCGGGLEVSERHRCDLILGGGGGGGGGRGREDQTRSCLLSPTA